MNRRHIFLLMVCFAVAGLIVGGVVWGFLWKFAPRYTAQTAVEVLPPGEVDPMRFGGGQASKDLHYQLRFTKAAFIKQENTLLELLKKDKIRETNWYAEFENDSAKAMEALSRNLKAVAQREGNWILLSMTCGDKKESALIVNEMMDLFLKMQREIATRGISNQLTQRNAQKRTIMSELYTTEERLDNLRETTGFAGLGEHDFGAPITKRVERLDIEVDNLVLEISQAQANIENIRSQDINTVMNLFDTRIEHDPVLVALAQRLIDNRLDLAAGTAESNEENSKVNQAQKLIDIITEETEKRRIELAERIRQANLRKAEDNLNVLQKKFEDSKQMRDDAKDEHMRLAANRADYDRIATIRDDKRAMLENINTYIEKLNALYNDPDLSKVRSVGRAPEPLQTSSPRLECFLGSGMILGLILGAVIGLLTKKPKT